MQIPDSQDLPIGKLASCFNKTVATYKFYWFLSIIETVEEGKITASKNELFASMVANAWYTINYFHVSFGKADNIEDAIKKLKVLEKIDIDTDRKSIIKKLTESNLKETQRELQHFDSNVPHWFLSPWFSQKDKKEIYETSQRFDNQCLYALYKDKIVINPEWISYLKKNAGILKAFCFWNLTLFLQNRNPNVPDIPNKLIKPAKRGSLNKQKRDFWDIVLAELGTISCIYSDKKLQIGGYAVEHFVPHAFVSHDLIWNLIPADSSSNSSKSDKLPQLDRYFDGFYALQETAVEIIKFKAPANKYLEDYLSIFPNLILSKEKFRETIQPLITIANNNGFEFMKQ